MKATYWSNTSFLFLIPCFVGSVRLVGRDVELELVLALKKIKVRIEALP